MARPRSIPDQVVFETTLNILSARGEKAVTFSAVGEAVGLAASSLAERHGSVAQLLQDARAGIWQAILPQTAACITEVEASGKGPVALLKALTPLLARVRLADPAQFGAWRKSVEEAVAAMFEAPKPRESAAILVSVWLGQQLWGAEGTSKVRLKDVVKRLQ